MRRVILCYHKVGPEAEEGRFLNVPPERLAAQIGFLQRRGFLIGDVPSVLSARVPAVALTFDDAYESAATHGAEVMNRARVTGTFFVVSHQTTSAWDGERARTLASREQLLALVASGHHLENHTAHHRSLADPEVSPREEIAPVEDFLAGLDPSRRRRPRGLCSPYGHYDARTLAAYRALDLAWHVTLLKGPLRADSPPDQLPRIVIGCGDGVPGLLYKLWLRRYAKPRYI